VVVGIAAAADLGLAKMLAQYPTFTEFKK